MCWPLPGKARGPLRPHANRESRISALDGRARAGACAVSVRKKSDLRATSRGSLRLVDLSKAFAEVTLAARKAAGRTGKHAGGIVLLVDEADALAQSHELAHAS